MNRSSSVAHARFTFTASLVLYFLVPSALQAQETERQATERENGEQRGEPDEVNVALQHFRRGVTLYEEGNFEAAAFEFERAYAVAPNYRVLYNIGLSRRDLHDYAGAFRAFTDYLQEGEREIPPERLKAVRQELERLRERVGRIRVDVDESDAEIFVDDRTVGKSPLNDAVLVSIGRHRIRAQHKGRIQFRTVDVSGDEERVVTISFPEVASEGSTNTGTPRDEPAPPSRRPLRTVGVITGVVGVGAVIALALAIKADGDLDDELDQVPASPSSVESTRDRLDATALATDILGAATLAGAAVTVGIAIWQRNRFREYQRSRETKRSTKVAVTPLGLSLESVF